MQTVDIITLSLSATAIIVSGLVSFYTYTKSKTVTCYQNLDGLYLEVLKLGMEHTSFVNRELTRDYKKNFSGVEKIKYELYAFMVWNVCETIYDHRSDGVFKTWECVIKVENNIHRNWFDTEDNHCRFKPEFREYVNKLETT